MEEHSASHCHHIAQLPPCPKAEDLPALRKGLRRRKLPTFEVGFHGSHRRLGEFRFSGSAGGTRVQWHLADGRKGAGLLKDLNTQADRELDRLAVGWLIANMYQLDGIHTCESIPDLREMMRMMARFTKGESAWRHWAIVPAGHMNLG